MHKVEEIAYSRVKCKRRFVLKSCHPATTSFQWNHLKMKWLLYIHNLFFKSIYFDNFFKKNCTITCFAYNNTINAEGRFLLDFHMLINYALIFYTAITLHYMFFCNVWSEKLRVFLPAPPIFLPTLSTFL